MTSLAEELRRNYDEADVESGRVTSAILFGVRHSGELRGMSLPSLVREAGLPPSYATEVRKGVRLASHVILRSDLGEDRADALSFRSRAPFSEVDEAARPEAKSFASFLLEFPGLDDLERTDTKVRDLDL